MNNISNNKDLKTNTKETVKKPNKLNMAKFEMIFGKNDPVITWWRGLCMEIKGNQHNSKMTINDKPILEINSLEGNLIFYPKVIANKKNNDIWKKFCNFWREFQYDN